jgi:PAT family beta-lactamase induction signal transducer AmpG
VLADTIGWRNFFLSTVLFGIPGMLMLARFVPWRARDVSFEARGPARGAALSRRALVARSVLGGLLGLAAGLAGVALVGGLSGLRAHRGFAAIPAVVAVLRPARIADWTTAIGVVVLALLLGLGTAATLVARHEPPETAETEE